MADQYNEIYDQQKSIRYNYILFQGGFIIETQSHIFSTICKILSLKNLN